MKCVVPGSSIYRRERMSPEISSPRLRLKRGVEVNDDMEIDAPQDYTSATLNSGLPTATTRTVPTEEMEADFAEEASSGFIDDRSVIDRPFNMNERFVTVLDQLDTRVERLRKEALGLQEKRDYLLMSIDLIKHNEVLQALEDYEREEITCYIQRVSSRLSTIELNVKTVRDRDQEESLCQVNTMIDSLITHNDPVMARQRCQAFLNACCASDQYSEEDITEESSTNSQQPSGSSVACVNPLFHDKKFESALLGCTLDDQKNIKKRLLALMDYLNRQTISD